ncbi:branched-chain amino acid abc transporter atp-binding protein [Lasius niger]|uniref:Branched-chain amino acid abc transporter atp-binding protein n=1 Tax=Lasius niger TaxID=67767 RepID=A0A0J7KJY3_LASNI|nr:branched-chain amino acid abc transporter atp-binding protein [Lasius niger]KMQ90748.1 branched-chain amino acid abc transporter atp-binding protein [Lasius niger]
MIPAAEETTLEELAEVPVIDQAQDVPNAEPEVIEQNPDKHQGHNPDENREENPDVHREDSQANVDKQVRRF